MAVPGDKKRTSEDSLLSPHVQLCLSHLLSVLSGHRSLHIFEMVAQKHTAPTTFVCRLSERCGVFEYLFVFVCKRVHDEEMNWSKIEVSRSLFSAILPLRDLSVCLCMSVGDGWMYADSHFPHISAPQGVIPSHHLPTATRAHYRNQTDVF